mmetsp:Transcript_32036/g.70097  ORF Transcript_32036/g.70097 Transcript_32036/m.70097 type:complete len:297 (+) Transcript_32036:1310-2200(+)
MAPRWIVAWVAPARRERFDLKSGARRICNREHQIRRRRDLHVLDDEIARGAVVPAEMPAKATAWPRHLSVWRDRQLAGAAPMPHAAQLTAEDVPISVAADGVTQLRCKLLVPDHVDRCNVALLTQRARVQRRPSLGQLTRRIDLPPIVGVWRSGAKNRRFADPSRAPVNIHPILKPRRERAVQPVGHGRAVIGQEVPEPEDASAVLVLDVPCKLHHLGHVPVREGQQRPCGGEARAALALAVAAAATKRRRDRRTDEGVLVHTAAPKRDVRQNVRLVGVVPAKWTGLTQRLENEGG